MTGKYIILRALDLEFAVIFPGTISHCQAVGKDESPVSAGFFQRSPETGAIVASGFSDTLNLNSRPEDADIISKSLFLAGIK